MIKKTITYKNWDDEEVTEDFYFNLNEAELLELEVSVGKAGFIETVQAAIKAETMNIVLDAFKRLIRLSIGNRVDDRFIKSDEIADHFMQTNAYSSLFVELMTDTNAAANFVNGIMPKAIQEQVANSKDQLVLDMQAKIDEMKVPAEAPVVDVPLPIEGTVVENEVPQ